MGPSISPKGLLWLDEILHHLKQSGNADSPENTHKQWFPIVSKWCERISSIHGIEQSDGVM